MVPEFDVQHGFGRTSNQPIELQVRIYLYNNYLLTTPGNDRGDVSDSIGQSNQISFPFFQSIKHERVHDFHSQQFSC